MPRRISDIQNIPVSQSYCIPDKNGGDEFQNTRDPKTLLDMKDAPVNLFFKAE